MDDKAQNERTQRDRQLIQRVTQGDATAIDEFYAIYFDACYWTAYRQTGNHHTAEELADEAVLKAIASAAKYDAKKGTPRGWVHAVICHAVIDWQRKQKHRRGASLDAADADDGGPMAAVIASREPTAQERVEASERAELIQIALLKLAAQLRAVLVLRDLRQVSAPETALALGLSVEVVGQRLFRARRQLKQVLEEKWPDLFTSREA